MLRRLTLLKYLHEITLSPADTLALIRRLTSARCRAEDDEVLIRLVRAHIELSANVLEAAPVVEPSLPARKAQRQRQSAKSARGRHRRSLQRGVDTAFRVQYLLCTKRHDRHRPHQGVSRWEAQ